MLIIILIILYFYFIYQNGILLNTNKFNTFEHGKKYKFKIPINKDEYLIFWYYKNNNNNINNKTIIYFSGYFESYNLYFTPNRIKLFTNEPFNLNFIICDYRGMGLSKGKYNESNMLQDGIYLINYLINNKENKILNINISDIILYGYSISTITILHINKYLFLYNLKPYKIILEAPLYIFSSNKLINKLIKKYIKYEFKSNIINNIHFINSPILILHGYNDSIISYKQSIFIIKNIQNNNKINQYLYYVLIKNSGHHNILKNNKIHKIMYNFLKN